MDAERGEPGAPNPSLDSVEAIVRVGEDRFEVRRLTKRDDDHWRADPLPSAARAHLKAAAVEPATRSVLVGRRDFLPLMDAPSWDEAGPDAAWGAGADEDGAADDDDDDASVASDLGDDLVQTGTYFTDGAGRPQITAYVLNAEGRVIGYTLQQGQDVLVYHRSKAKPKGGSDPIAASSSSVRSTRAGQVAPPEPNSVQLGTIVSCDDHAEMADLTWTIQLKGGSLVHAHHDQIILLGLFVPLLQKGTNHLEMIQIAEQLEALRTARSMEKALYHLAKHVVAVLRKAFLSGHRFSTSRRGLLSAVTSLTCLELIFTVMTLRMRPSELPDTDDYTLFNFQYGLSLLVVLFCLKAIQVSLGMTFTLDYLNQVAPGTPVYGGTASQAALEKARYMFFSKTSTSRDYHDVVRWLLTYKVVTLAFCDTFQIMYPDIYRLLLFVLPAIIARVAAVSMLLLHSLGIPSSKRRFSREVQDALSKEAEYSARVNRSNARNQQVIADMELARLDKPRKETPTSSLPSIIRKRFPHEPLYRKNLTNWKHFAMFGACLILYVVGFSGVELYRCVTYQNPIFTLSELDKIYAPDGVGGNMSTSVYNVTAKSNATAPMRLFYVILDGMRISHLLANKEFNDMITSSPFKEDGIILPMSAQLPRYTLSSHSLIVA